MTTRAELKQQSREKILNAASRMIRQQGIEGTNVNEIMAEAGLTRGGFYSHFENKDELVQLAFRHAMAQGREYLLDDLEELETKQAIDTLSQRYQSTQKSRKSDNICAMAALGSNIGLLDNSASIKEAFSAELAESSEQIAKLLSVEVEEDSEFDHSEKSLAILASLVGSMVLARASGDDKLAQKVLDSSRKQILNSL